MFRKMIGGRPCAAATFDLPESPVISSNSAMVEAATMSGAV